jgi:hypothetical protein
VLKEKKDGFLYLFSDKEIRGTAITTFVLSALLVSLEYIANIVPLNVIYAIAMASYIVFQYLFLFFFYFNVFRMFGAFSDKRKHRNAKVSLWVIRLLAGGSVALLDAILLIVTLVPFLFIVVISFLIWCAMESFFLCKLAAELASFTRRRGFRFLAYLFFMIVFAAYLVISLWIAVGNFDPGTPTPVSTGIGTSAFDWILTLVMLFFTFASMGERFLAAEGIDKLDFSKLSGKQGARIRSTVVFLLFSVIGFELFVRGFIIISTFLPIVVVEFGNIAYYSVKLFFFVPVSVGFLIAVIVKRISKVPGTQ